MVSVIRHYKWTPEYVEGLYLDDADLHSLEFWYNDIKELFTPKKKNDNEQ